MTNFPAPSGRAETPATTPEEFWDWFIQRSDTFFNLLRDKKDIEAGFLDVLGPRLNQMNRDLLFLAGMDGHGTAELIFTCDGRVRSFPFVHDLVNAAPQLKGWKFIALKPPSDPDMIIEMAGHRFEKSLLSFYPNISEGMPDEIDITVVYRDHSPEHEDIISNGVYVFLDNYLGEYQLTTTMDNITVKGSVPEGVEPIPIEKLRDYLIWRQKEFVEKYEGVRRDTEKDNYSTMEARLPDGAPVIAVINTDLLKWDRKASHPWVMIVELTYDGAQSNGMPDAATYELLNEIEDEILKDLKDSDGYLNIGRETGDNTRRIFFACKEYEKATRVVMKVKQEQKGGIDLDHSIFLDKYWQAFKRFSP